MTNRTPTARPPSSIDALEQAGPDVIRARLNRLLAQRCQLNTEIAAVEELLLQRCIEKRDGLWPPSAT